MDKQPRVLVLGGSGMLGHAVCRYFCNRFDAYTVVRSAESFSALPKQNTRRLAEGESIGDLICQLAPRVVVNCIGVVKQSPRMDDLEDVISTNALLPHRLESCCRREGARLIHISTDCVFSGSKGNYSETDTADADDLYGRSKLLGEVSSYGCLTLRTSIIGREVGTHRGLLEWLLGRAGLAVQGYTRSWFSGVTTLELAKILAGIIQNHRDLSGVYHVASSRISKHDLLLALDEVYDLDVTVIPNESIECDRSLDDRRFREATGIIKPDWDSMIIEMYKDSSLYPG